MIAHNAVIDALRALDALSYKPGRVRRAFYDIDIASQLGIPHDEQTLRQLRTALASTVRDGHAERMHDRDGLPQTWRLVW